MMENPRPEEEKIIKDIKDLFRLTEEQNDTAVKDITSFQTKRRSIITNIKNLFEYEKEEEKYYKFLE